MDALSCVALAIALSASPTATYRTANFVVTAPTAEFAKQVGDAAEVYRRELSKEWTGRVMPRWSGACPIFVKVGQIGAGGATTFQFERGEVYGWNMKIQGSPERILDSVLPHEINHTIFACHFRQPLPRWADEGAASLIEHESERGRLKKIHEQVVGKTEAIPLRQLLSMKNYPADERQVLVLYAEGYSLADYLIQLSDRPYYLKFLSAALQQGWEPALKEFYGYDRLERLQQDLDRWVVAGSPDLPSKSNVWLARGRGGKPVEPVIRAQSPETAIVLGAPGPWPKRVEPNAIVTAARSRATLTQPVANIAGDNSRQPRINLLRP
jgi:hypothetical protein